MKMLRRALPALAAAAFCSTTVFAADAVSAATGRWREISWLDLVPKDWKPQERLDRKKAQSLQDGDALAREMMKEMREVLDTAPTVEAMNGAEIKMPGYVVPLEQTKEGLTEFLLVPYYGACIHYPPPPANQIVHVTSGKPMKGFETLSAVWVRGTLRTA
ncbi:MAG TPA: DUF3299 domain-containing protein, partial [Albitalea sp.]